MRQRATFIDRDHVGDAIARVEHNTRCTTRGIERQNRLNVNVKRRRIKSFKHDLRHLFAVGFRVQGGLGEQDGVFFGGDAKFVVEGMVPDLFHIGSVGHDAVFDWILRVNIPRLACASSLRRCQDYEFVVTSFLQRTDVSILLTHSHHDIQITGATDNGTGHCKQLVPMQTGKTYRKTARGASSSMGDRSVECPWLDVANACFSYPNKRNP